MPPGDLLIDSSGWVEYFRGTPTGERVASYLGGPGVVTLTFVMAEMSYLLHRDLDDQKEIDANLDRIRFLSRIEGFTEEEAVLAGRIRADLERRGNRKGSYADCIQIAVARGRGAKVLSKDSIFKEVAEGIYIGED
jgi:predicted nucleic acid-binding protein